MRRPGLAVFWLDMREAGARRRVWNTDEVVAGRTLNLPTGKLRFALQRLVAVGTIKFEFVCAHSLHPHHAQNCHKKYMRDFFILSVARMRM
jgi:hypothetical protein